MTEKNSKHMLKQPCIAGWLASLNPCYKVIRLQISWIKDSLLLKKKTRSDGRRETSRSDTNTKIEFLCNLVSLARPVLIRQILLLGCQCSRISAPLGPAWRREQRWGPDPFGAGSCRAWGRCPAGSSSPWPGWWTAWPPCPRSFRSRYESFWWWTSGRRPTCHRVSPAIKSLIA